MRKRLETRHSYNTLAVGADEDAVRLQVIYAFLAEILIGDCVDNLRAAESEGGFVATTWAAGLG